MSPNTRLKMKLKMSGWPHEEPKGKGTSRYKALVEERETGTSQYRRQSLA